MSNWNGGARVSAVLMAAELGKWRYVIAGSLLAFLLFAVCRLIGSLTAPFGMRRRFSGICTEADGNRVCVRFQDARLITHTAAFALPDSVPVSPGDAVRFAVRTARRGDIVLFAGKGHENYQIVRGEKVPFSERAVLLDEAAKELAPV